MNPHDGRPRTIGLSLAISDLKADEVESAVSLWETCGLTRPWNDARADASLALQCPTSTILAARGEGHIAGTAMVGVDGHRGWVYYLAVSPELRGCDLGHALMRAAERWVVQQGVPKIQLMVRGDNIAAMGFYPAIGYVAEPVTVFSRRLDL